MPNTEEKIQPAATDKQLDPAVASRKSGRKSILALSVFALGLNATAAVYTLSPSDFALPNVSGLMAELLPHESASAPIPEPVVAALKDVQWAQQQHAASLQENSSSLQQNTALLQSVVAALKDIQSAQQQHAASLQENSSSLQQNTALLQQDSTILLGLRQSLTDERVDIKKLPSQLSTLIAKVDLLQHAIASETTSSIPKGRARNRLSHKRGIRLSKPAGPISVGGAPLTRAPTQGWGTLQNPEG
jgi:hypothetical protein